MPEYCGWSLTDNSVANIEWSDDSQCQIEFVSAGTVTLSATTEIGLSDSITFTVSESKQIEFITVDNFNADLTNTVLNVVYNDSTDIIPLNVVVADGGDEFKQIVCRSDKGLFSVILNIHYDQNGYKDGYMLEVFGFFVFVTDPFGDINGDGASDIRDLIRLKKLLADATQEGADRADLDGDGNLGSTDAAKMRIYLLRKIDF